MVAELVRRARRRFLANEILAQFAWALSAGFGAVILLLLLGTEILSWHWLVLLPAGTFGLGLYRTWRRLPTLYGVAQLVDRRLGLADTLSTALHFSSGEPGMPVSEEICLAQQAQAERLAAAAVVEQAVPLRMPRAVYATLLLGCVASSLFALRYGLDRRLDLRPPLARVVMDAMGLGPRTREMALAKKKLPPEHRSPLQDAVGVSVPDGQQKTPDALDAAPDSALDTVGDPDADNSKAVQTPGNAKSKAETPGSQQMEDSSEQEAAENSPGNAGEKPGDGQQGPGKGKNPGESPSGAQSSAAMGDNSSLLNKFRDAMANLMSRMRPPQGNGSQQASGKQAQQGKGQQANGGQGGKDGQQPGAQQQGDAQDGQDTKDAQAAQNAQGKGAGQSADEQTSKQPGSGIGRQDGSKDVKLAEQQAAMGKISEIIGKRSANVSGEVTVEVQSSNQQLKTPYAQKSVHHAESGGEINRDEVPVVLQPYVQQYFEQVRKTAPASGDAGSRTRPDTRSPDSEKGVN
ncbi:MAG TPA: hypothetical protein VFA33_11095 [Bryobacteraceae bacterium]|nr:hypothetical protein [Bryobacteraceae bacterium]